jgi:hypothetical protein
LRFDFFITAASSRELLTPRDRQGLHYGVSGLRGAKGMPLSEKDRLASAVQERRIDFNMALSDKRRYPIAQFRAFWEAGRRYARDDEA